VSQTVAAGTTVINKDVWVCGPGTATPPQITLRVYWDTNANGILDTTDPSIGAGASLTVN